MEAPVRKRPLARRSMIAWWLAAVAMLAGCTPPSDEEATAERNISLLIVVDGLRPDYITPDLMPNLHALGERGVFGERHTAVFPSVTRVNSASVSTGSYPVRHGLMHNTMYVAELSPEPINTGSARELREVLTQADGSVLAARSLAEVLDEHGLRLFVTGSGGSGTSLLQNPRPVERASTWTARGFSVPEDARDDAIAAVGDLASSNAGRTVWSFDAYLRLVSSDEPPQAVLMWINEPDAAGHRHGVGAPDTLRVLANVDEQIGRVVAAHEELELVERVNIFVTTDHGFSTGAGGFDIRRTLQEEGIGDRDVTVVSNMIFLNQDDPALPGRVVEALQRDPHVGNIYTRPARPGASEGSVPGTLSTAVIQWDHERAADVLVAQAWSDEVNEYGFAGTSARGGVAGHGSDSPYELQIRMVAAGPDIKQSVRSDVPTGNVDLAPTILHLLGVEAPPDMSGRVLHELLRAGPPPREIRVHEHVHSAAVTFGDGFRYQAELETHQVGATVYVRGARTTRRQASAP